MSCAPPHPTPMPRCNKRADHLQKGIGKRTDHSDYQFRCVWVGGGVECEIVSK